MKCAVCSRLWSPSMKQVNWPQCAYIQISLLFPQLLNFCPHEGYVTVPTSISTCSFQSAAFPAPPPALSALFGSFGSSSTAGASLTASMKSAANQSTFTWTYSEEGMCRALISNLASKLFKTGNQWISQQSCSVLRQRDGLQSSANHPILLNQAGGSMCHRNLQNGSARDVIVPKNGCRKTQEASAFTKKGDMITTYQRIILESFRQKTNSH